MFFSASLLSYALLASTVLAAPSSRGKTSKTATITTTGPTSTATSSPPLSAPGPAILSSNIWAGAGMESPENTYQSVTGTLVVPHLQPATGGAIEGIYGGSAWVGLDGMTCQTSLMATGIQFIYFNQTILANAWTEVYPNPSVDITSMTVNAGDTIKLTLTATSTTTGTAVVENLSNGQSSTVDITSPSPLCLANAEWIVEDFEEGTFLMPFANFGTITFTDASATTRSGSTVGPSGDGSHIINMVQSGRQFASASCAASTVTVDYLTSIPF
ncbi:peptidase A4 family-domain-containing protein [Mycena pura]|uniref:Peptidase A4 family-domain-containing protein n=1 Tax=Mycena pura TaxID=153505 RepID=A0AAD6UTG9_9AGAR|nr:peptidase A4 family-domain-containing protein [Mycena pura]